MLELFQQSAESPVVVLYAMVLGVAAIGIIVELAVAGATGRRLFSLADSAANVLLYAGYIVIGFIWVSFVFRIYTAVGDHALVRFTVGGWHIGVNGLWWEWAVLFVLEDLCFYIFHRMSHRVRFLWASHVTHHSSHYFNLTVAFRQTWIPFTAFVFWLPLLLIGFDPLMVMAVQFISLSYQEILHTQIIPRLGPIEWIFNTPTHHSVHHGSNPEYIDKNFGGVLIIWDRLFGTYAPKDAKIEFGIGEDFESNNPLVVAFHEWWAMLRGILKSRSPRQLWVEVIGASPEKP